MKSNHTPGMAASPFPAGPRSRAGLLSRVEHYLGNGGLFNPEYMEHGKVRDLILDIREYLMRAQIESLAGTGGFWRGDTGKILTEHAYLLMKLGLPDNEAFAEIVKIVLAMRAEYGE